MPIWQWMVLTVAVGFTLAGIVFGAWIRRSGLTAMDAAAELHTMGLDLVKLPGRLRRLAADDRVPRSTRWMLIGLAIYIASPMDLIPDFLPVIGQLDDAIIVPLVLLRVRGMIPREVWNEHFPKRPESADRVEDAR